MTDFAANNVLRVIALHVGYIDMIRHLDGPKSDRPSSPIWPSRPSRPTNAQIIADETSRRILAGLSAGVAGLYPQVA